MGLARRACPGLGPRRVHRRIPARLEVEVVGPGLQLVGLTTNVSQGGAALRLVGAL